ncbi:MAG TPA: UdgX family uracil-DNA binding protein [Ramlibacter sp.]|nr:UdgX family uracil-DNA binding protein [Ramlibacter sp.]
MHARLSSETDLAGFRAEARSLLAHQIPPDEVEWETDPGVDGDLFADPAPASDSRPRGVAKAASAIVPASFLRLCEMVVLHHDPSRFALLYRLLWRLVHEPGLRNNPIDPDMLHAQQMGQAVRRDMHKMKNFVRFHPMQDGAPGGEPLNLAWYEPAHHIVEAVAPWFAKRFARLRWAIMTPERSVRWDPYAGHAPLPTAGEDTAGPEVETGRLEFGPGVRPAQPPATEDDARWLVCYQRIFHPTPTASAPAQPTPQDKAPPLRDEELAAPDRPPPAAARGPALVLQRDEITSLDELKTATMRCRECPIGEFATQSVIGEGRLKAPLMLVGEQPGDQEDLQGHPFVGPAGRLLDRALEALGLPRDQVFVSNAVKHFKYELRGKRRIHKSPSQREAAACLHWLEDEIALVRPRALVALGATAARSLLGRPVAVMAERGQWLARADGLQVLVTVHPSALLRVPPEERDEAFADFVRDLKQARKLLEK